MTSVTKLRIGKVEPREASQPTSARRSLASVWMTIYCVATQKTRKPRVRNAVRAILGSSNFLFIRVEYTTALLFISLFFVVTCKNTSKITARSCLILNDLTLNWIMYVAKTMKKKNKVLERFWRNTIVWISIEQFFISFYVGLSIVSFYIGFSVLDSSFWVTARSCIQIRFLGAIWNFYKKKKLHLQATEWLFLICNCT